MTTQSKTFQRVTGLSAIGAGLTYIIGFWVFFSILGPAQYGSPDIPATQHVQFLVDHVDMLIVWNQVIYILNAVLLVCVVIGLHQRTRGAGFGLPQTATAFGLIWAGLILASGMVNHIGTIHVSRLAAQDIDAAVGLWRAMVMVGSGLGGGNEITGGLWILLLSLVSYRAKMIPRLIILLGAIVGVAGVLSTIPMLSMATIVVGLGFILWFFAIGIALIGLPQSVHGKT